MRPIGLIEAEVTDAAQQLADCIREQAKQLLLRADGIERGSKILTDGCDMDEAKDVEIAATDLITDMHISQMIEQELTLKYRRLCKEWEINKEREKRGK